MFFFLKKKIHEPLPLLLHLKKGSRGKAIYARPDQWGCWRGAEELSSTSLPSGDQVDSRSLPARGGAEWQRAGGRAPARRRPVSAPPSPRSCGLREGPRTGPSACHWSGHLALPRCCGAQSWLRGWGIRGHRL